MWECSQCFGTSEVYRPKKSYSKNLSLEQIRDGIAETTIKINGGSDACPECSAKAEAHYQSREDRIY